MKTIRIKFSTPWTHIRWAGRISSNQPSDYIYLFNQPEEPVDFWVVWGGLASKEESAICPPENIIYLTDEVHEQRHFYQRFINQFAAVITCRDDLWHRNIIPCHELNTWMVKCEFDELYNKENYPKTKAISVIASDYTWLPGHKKRYAFINQLYGHFKDRIDIFGKGINPVDDKLEALAPYRYSVAIENSAVPGYFTEKLADCFLTHTMPVYHGCPDIHNYFDRQSMMLINPAEPLKAISMIEQLLEDDPYESLLPLIRQQKRKYLDSLHIFNKLPVLLRYHFQTKNKPRRITIRAEHTFARGKAANYYFGLFQRFLRIPVKYRCSLQFNQEDLYSNQRQSAQGNV